MGNFGPIKIRLIRNVLFPHDHLCYVFGFEETRSFVEYALALFPNLSSRFVFGSGLPQDDSGGLCADTEAHASCLFAFGNGGLARFNDPAIDMCAVLACDRIDNLFSAVRQSLFADCSGQ